MNSDEKTLKAMGAGSNESDTGSVSGGSSSSSKAVETVSSSSSEYADEFAEISYKLDAMNASSAVLIVALFMSCGIMAVTTLVHSLENW